MTHHDVSDRLAGTPSSERALSAIYASTIAPALATPVRVEGHTDDRGSDEHNLDLSQRRADRVRGWLVTHGRNEAGLSTEAFGEKKPRVPNYVLAGKTQVSDKRVRVRIRLSPAGKLVFLHQFQRL